MGGHWLRWAALLLATSVALGVPYAQGGEERYDYDAAGRLVRVIDEQGRVTEYVYDPAGNLLQVITGASAQAPAVSGISPASIRRGETRAVTIAGTGLNGAHLAIADPGLDIANLRSSATQVTFDLTATAAAALGAQVIAISNAAGSAATAIAVNPVLPKLGMSPQPIAVPPTNSARSFFVSLSSADSIPHTVNLVSANTAIAAVSPASVTIPAGQTEAIVAVTGKAAGNTSIALGSPPDLASTSVPVFVTADFSGITTSYAPLLGVVKTPPPPGPVSTTYTPIAGPLVGVARGAFLQSIEPNAFGVGGGAVTMTVRGSELGGVTGVTFTPPDGVTLGAISIAADGKSLAVPVTVAANAPAGTRRVSLSGAQQPYIAARAGVDQVLIAQPAPAIESVAPNFAVAGTTAMAFTVRGRNLQLAQSVAFTPSAGIEVGATPSASADGTTVTLAISVSSVAATGPRVVTLTTPTGTSDPSPSPANTFNVVNQVIADYSPVVAPLVGVVLQSTPAPGSQTFSAFSPLLGVVVPPAVTSMSPTVGIIGQSLTLTLGGAGLGGVTAVQAVPPDGLTIGAPSVDAGGTSVTAPVTVAGNAAQTLRTIKVLAGAANIPFSNASGALFRVSAPLPQVDAISPIVLQVGASAVTLTAYGRNFQNASALRVDPPAGLTISPPTLNADGSQASVSISAAAGAATGPRTLIAVTPAGESATAASPANTLTLVNTIQAQIAPIVAPALGVVLQSPAAPVSTFYGPFVSPVLGVMLETEPQPPASVTRPLFGSALGVAVGAYASSVQAGPLTPNASTTLTVSGGSLADVTAVQLSPPEGISVGALTLAPDGTQVSVPLTLSGAAAGPRTVVVLRGTERATFAPAGRDVIRIAPGAPNIDSITPILANRGQSFSMLIRGQNFLDATAIAATPGSGIAIGSLPVVNAAGTEITVQIGIAADAPPGASVFRVFTPGGATTESAVAANTFTVLE